MEPQRAGVILAGGRSTRFGDADKAVADLAGTPMIRRVADRILPVIESLVVNCRGEQVDRVRSALAGYDLAVTVAEDPEPDLGPTAGIAAGLRATRAESAVVVACDMPFVDPDLVAYLFERAGSHDAAVPRPDEYLQTTQAVYRARAMAEACEAALRRGDRRVVEALSDLDYVEVGEAEIRQRANRNSFLDVNTPADYETAVRRYDGAPASGE